MTVPGFKPDVKLLMAIHAILQRPMTNPSPLLKCCLRKAPPNTNPAVPPTSKALPSQNEKIPVFRLGDILQGNGLAFFIEACHVGIENHPGVAMIEHQTGGTSALLSIRNDHQTDETNSREAPGGEYDRDILKVEIERALLLSTVHLRHKPLKYIQSLSNSMIGEEQEAGAVQAMGGGGGHVITHDEDSAMGGFEK